jgi:hypothetical protein
MNTELIAMIFGAVAVILRTTKHTDQAGCLHLNRWIQVGRNTKHREENTGALDGVFLAPATVTTLSTKCDRSTGDEMTFVYHWLCRYFMITRHRPGQCHTSVQG